MRPSAQTGEVVESQYQQEPAVPAPVAEALSSDLLALEYSPAALGLATLAGDLLYLNAAAKRVFGITQGADLAGRNIADICTEMGQLSTLREVARDGRERQLRISRRRENALPARLECKLTRIAGCAGIPTWLAFAGLERDDSDRGDNVPLDEGESMSVIRRVTGIAAWKMRIEDWDNWMHSPVRWGSGLQPLLNLKPDGPDITPRSFLEFAARDDREQLQAAFEKSLQNGSRFEAVYRLNPRYGAPKVVLSRAVLVTDEGASPEPTWVGTVQDITSAMGGEVRAYVKAGVLDTIAANMEAPVYAVDRDLRYLYMNVFFAQMMRHLYGVDAVLGDRACEALPDDARRRTVLAHLRRALAGTRVVEEISISLDDALERRYELTYSPMRSTAATTGVTVFGIPSPGAVTSK
jgi:PAS domain-containing protein